MDVDAATSVRGSPPRAPRDRDALDACLSPLLPPRAALATDFASFASPEKDAARAGGGFALEHPTTFASCVGGGGWGWVGVGGGRERGVLCRL
jgi:hypothetical protein